MAPLSTQEYNYLADIIDQRIEVARPEYKTIYRDHKKRLQLCFVHRDDPNTLHHWLIRRLQGLREILGAPPKLEEDIAWEDMQ